MALSRVAREARLCAFGPAIGAGLGTALAELGYATRQVDTTRAAVAVAAELGEGAEPEAVLVAAGEPDLEAARALIDALVAQDPPLGVPLLLAVPDAALRTAGVCDGIDELVILPVSADELGARIALAWSRRVSGSGGELLSFAGISLDPETHRAMVDERRVDLTYIEFRLLRFFLSHPNRVYTREALLERVWGYEHYAETRTVDVHVRRLRSKLGADHAATIKTVRSVGYRLER